MAVTRTGIMRIELRYFAAAAAVLGRESATVLLDDGCRLSELVVQIERDVQQGAGAGYDPATVSRVLARCSFIVNGVSTSDRAVALADGDLIDVLPPFAGG